PVNGLRSTSAWNRSRPGKRAETRDSIQSGTSSAKKAMTYTSHRCCLAKAAIWACTLIVASVRENRAPISTSCLLVSFVTTLILSKDIVVSERQPHVQQSVKLAHGMKRCVRLHVVGPDGKS